MEIHLLIPIILGLYPFDIEGWAAWLEGAVTDDLGDDHEDCALQSEDPE